MVLPAARDRHPAARALPRRALLGVHRRVARWDRGHDLSPARRSTPGAAMIGERAGRPIKRLQTTERVQDARRRMPDAARVVLVLATIWLIVGAPVRSNGSELGASLSYRVPQ